MSIASGHPRASRRGPAQELRRQARGSGFEVAVGQTLYGDLTIISPTINSERNMNLIKKNLNLTPLARYLFNKSRVFSEIIVGEIIVKSPYED